jgi:hypothetical protein
MRRAKGRGHVIVHREAGLIFHPIPKNACSTVKHLLFEMEFGRPFDCDRDGTGQIGQIHQYYKARKDARAELEGSKELSGMFRFAIVRDPVKRLISCYRQKVVDEGTLRTSEQALRTMHLSTDPDLDFFVLNLENYRKGNRNIRDHTLPQAACLGGSLDFFDRLYPIEAFAAVFEMLREFSPGLKMRRMNTSVAAVGLGDLSEPALKAAIEFYADDYGLLSEFYSPGNIRDEWMRAREGK